MTKSPYFNATGAHCMRQAIETRFIGPTNTHGSRIKAICQARTVTVERDHALNIEDAHFAAALTLAQKLGWTTDGSNMRGGGMPGKHTGYAFVFID